jgi:hypothetical protein
LPVLAGLPAKVNLRIGLEFLQASGATKIIGVASVFMTMCRIVGHGHAAYRILHNACLFIAGSLVLHFVHSAVSLVPYAGSVSGNSPH